MKSLKITAEQITKYGGILSALTQASEKYIRTILQGEGCLDNDEKVLALQNIIVHTAPHIDEYMASLLFRACLPDSLDTSVIQFKEITITSENNDLNCQHLFPVSAVLGIGRVASGGADILYLFDEHDRQSHKKRTASSCTDIVASQCVSNLPASISVLLREINAIDSYGNAHPQHLGNIIKMLHETFSVDKKTIDYLDANWKRSLIDACLCAVIFCIENEIDLYANPKEKGAFLKKSFEFYTQKSTYRNHEIFDKVANYLKSSYSNQQVVFNAENAFLRDNEKKNIIGKHGEKTPQILLFSRVAFACYHCWGEVITNAILLHFWEILFKSQMNFQLAYGLFKPILETELGCHRIESNRTEIGRLYRRIVGNNLWVMHFTPNKIEFTDGSAKKALTKCVSSLNNQNGILLLEDPYLNTKALFKLGSDDVLWKRLVKRILSMEPDCWYEASSNFILNGSKAHLERPKSKLDIDLLVESIQSLE